MRPFSVRTALRGDTGGQTRSPPVVEGERGSLETQQKMKVSIFLSTSSGPNFFVTWVPNRQNQSPTDEIAPSAPQNGHTSGPRDAWDPKQGSTGPHLAYDQLWSMGVSPRTAFLACSGPNPLKLPETHKNPPNRELRPQEAEPSKVQNIRKLCNTKAVPMALKNLRWRRVTAETAPCRKPMVQPGFEPRSSPPLSPP